LIIIIQLVSERMEGVAKKPIPVLKKLEFNKIQPRATIPTAPSATVTAPSAKALSVPAPSATAPSAKALSIPVSIPAPPATVPSTTVSSVKAITGTVAKAALTTTTAATAISTAQATKAVTKTVTTVTTTAPAVTNVAPRKMFQKFRPVSTKLHIATEVTQEKIENARAGDKTVIDHISEDEAVEIYKLMKAKKVSKDIAIRMYLENSDERLYNPKAVYLFPGDVYNPPPEEDIKERAMHHRPLFPGEIVIPADNDKDFYQSGSLSRSGSTPSISQLYEEKIEESVTNLSFPISDIPLETSFPPPVMQEKVAAVKQEEVVIEPPVPKPTVEVVIQPVEVIVPLRRVIGQKKDPDQEALEHAILLSQQEQAVGVNMYDSLTETDQVTLNRYMAQGFSRQESALMIFEQKHANMAYNPLIPAMPTLTSDQDTTVGGGTVSDEEEIQFLIRCGYTREQAIVVKQKEEKKKLDTRMHAPHPLEEQFNLTELEEREVQYKIDRKGYSRTKAVDRVVKMRDKVTQQEQQQPQQEIIHHPPQIMPLPYYSHPNPAAMYGSYDPPRLQYSQYDPLRLQYSQYPLPPLYGLDPYMETSSHYLDHQPYYPEPQLYYADPQSYYPEPHSFQPDSFYADPSSFLEEQLLIDQDPQSFYTNPQTFYPGSQSMYLEHHPQQFYPLDRSYYPEPPMDFNQSQFDDTPRTSGPYALKPSWSESSSDVLNNGRDLM